MQTTTVIENKTATKHTYPNVMPGDKVKVKHATTEDYYIVTQGMSAFGIDQQTLVDLKTGEFWSSQSLWGVLKPSQVTKISHLKIELVEET